MDAADTLDQVLLPASNVETGGGIAVSAFDSLDHAIDGQAVSRQPPGLDAHLELLHIAADGQHLGDAGNRQQPLAQHEICRFLQLHRVVLIRCQGDEHDFAHNRGGRCHDRHLDSRRQRGLGQLQLFGDDVAREVGISPPVEFDGDHRQADLGR